MIDGIPIPARDGPFEQEFWAALDNGQIVHQQCMECRLWHFPPRYVCECGGPLAFRPVSGRGTLWSYTVVHPPVLPAFSAFAPYVAAIIELDEQPGLRMAGNIVHRVGDPINAVSADELRIGMPLQAHVAPLADGVNWPVWMILKEDK